MMFKTGSTVFLIESNRLIREVTVVRRTGDLYVVRFKDSNGGIQVRGTRLYPTREDAERTVPNVKGSKKGYRSPYEYLH